MQDNIETPVNPEDFTAAEHAAVDAMAAPMLAHFEGERKIANRFNSRNRKAWNHMNRPEKTAKIDKGAEILGTFFDRVALDDIESTETI